MELTELDLNLLVEQTSTLHCHLQEKKRKGHLFYHFQHPTDDGFRAGCPAWSAAALQLELLHLCFIFECLLLMTQTQYLTCNNNSFRNLHQSCVNR